MRDRAADTSVPVLDAIRQRYSIYAFDDAPVPARDLQRVCEAGRWAASSVNKQPWRFIVGLKGDATHPRIFGCLNEKNQRWAGSAPVLMLAFAECRAPGDERKNPYAWHDVGAACAEMAVQCAAVGLRMHQMGGIVRERIREVFPAPEGYDAVEAIALGYPGDAATLPDDLRARMEKPRTRKSLGEIFFTGAWGTALPLSDG